MPVAFSKPSTAVPERYNTVYVHTQQQHMLAARLDAAAISGPGEGLRCAYHVRMRCPMASGKCTDVVRMSVP